MSVYTFQPSAGCVMCGATSSSHSVLGRRLNTSQGKAPWKKKGIAVSVVKCNQCGLISSDPMAIPESIQDHYGVAPDAYWKEEYFALKEDYFSLEINRLNQLRSIAPGMKALDIGAGVGKCMIALERAGFETYGCEPSSTFHRFALEKMKIDPSRLLCASLEEAEYPTESFDFITFGVVLEHLYRPGAGIEKALRWLRPGGLIHIEVPSSRWLIHRLVNAYYRMRGTDYVANLSPMHQPFHLYEFSLESFQAHGRKAGYEVAFHEQYVCDTYMPHWMDRILRPIMRSTNTGMQLCVWLRKR